MKVMHITTSLDDGGAEAVLWNLVTGDTTNEHRIVSLKSLGKYGGRLRERGFDVTTLDMRGLLNFAIAQGRLARLVRRDRVDVIQTWMYHADLMGSFASRASATGGLCWGIHNSTLDRTTPRSTRAVAKMLVPLSRRMPARIVSCSDAAADVHERLGYPRDRMRVVNNGYDVERFDRDGDAGLRVRHQLGIEPDVPLIGTVARYGAQKDHASLLDALGALRADGSVAPFRCLLVGAGMAPDNEILVRRIGAAGLDGVVVLAGPRPDVPAVMNALDLHVLPSAFGEAFPNVVAEAMACATPCVVTDVGDAVVMVGELGWSMPPSDPVALARTLAAALAEIGGPAWEERRRACRERAATRFTLGRMIEGYHEVWEEVGSGRTCSGVG